ncbi:MAG: acetyl-CoA carboxylase biotin carboxyl carrier protein subunit [Oscillospiraceae bacterium]|nr:acetyl-CoA carboxylase biotin carboxyl carrier protein subunit [Oscillospiraceae bacterium]
MKKYSVKVNGTIYDVEVEELAEGASSGLSAAASVPAAAPAPVAAAPVTSEPAPAPAAPAASAEGKPVLAPINGTILSVAVKVGDSIKRGGLLCMLEAMKMENEVYAPQDGVITAVNVSKGSTVDAGDPLFSIQ